MMNQYGTIARDYVQKWRPTAYSQIPEPDRHFTELGRVMENQVAHLSEALAGPDLPGEGYLEKVGRLNVARLQAEEKVLAEAVYSTPPEMTGEEEADELAEYQEWLARATELTRLDLQLEWRSNAEDDCSDMYEELKRRGISEPQTLPTVQEFMVDLPLEKIEALLKKLWKLLPGTLGSAGGLAELEERIQDRIDQARLREWPGMVLAAE